MPARVHALLVVRPDDRTSTAAHLERTLEALRAQTRPVDALTIVLCDPDAAVTELARSSGAEGVITASAATAYASAVRMAAPRLSGDAVWLLAQDTAPEPTALSELSAALELAPLLAVVAPKLVGWEERSQIVSLGVSMTRFGRAVGLADGELDQGQYDADADADVLGADVRGMLVRMPVWQQLDGLDPALGGADEGLDLGVRAHLAGHRVSVITAARVAVAGDGTAGLPAPTTRRRRRKVAYATRLAQLHRRLVYAPAPAVPLHWLSLLVLAVWRAAAALVSKQPSRVLPEWGASIVVFWRWASVARARRRIRRTRASSWTSFAALRISRSQLRQRLDADGDADAASRPVREELRFFTGGAAWIVLAAVVVSLAAFPALLAWPVLGGGALAPLSATVSQLWAEAGYGLRSIGLDTTGPADPFAALLALIGSVWPFDPSRALVLLWLAAVPLAVLGGWFAATRVTSRSLLRNTGAVLWALAPTFWIALGDGRPAVVIAHLLLPWLFYAGAVAHRSWAAAGAASLLLAGVLACVPSSAPALIVLWALTVMLTLVARRGAGVAHIVWIGVPAIAMFAPLVWTQLRAGSPWALVADPGVVVGSGSPAGAATRLALAAGFPDDGYGGWARLLEGGAVSLPGWTAALLVAPLVAAALLSLLTPRWMVAAVALVVTMLGLGTAFVAVGVQVSHTATGDPASLWPGGALSLAWLGLCAAAIIALDAGLPYRDRRLRPIGAAVLMATLAIAVLPAATSVVRDRAPLQNGPASTLPAYVAAQGRGDAVPGTLVITPLADGSVAARVVWGASDTLNGQSTVLATRTSATPADEEVAQLVADLVTPTAEDAVGRLAERGIRFVVVSPAVDGETDRARALRLTATTALDQRNELDDVGATPKGTLWRVTADVAPRAAAPDPHLGAVITIVQLLVVAAALLLSVPTATSRRQARRTSRMVGPRAREEER
ncbi:glycosyltransferase family 2 protein [Microbacterium sp. SORGH_AS_0888]|uniref:glycosyltransferase family 2 protein n=1 Tax=Microbacterium sp. SORGH_AS_0888 TaxID=3041791 RepID=UPI00277FAABE|nr:glycosyl transferase [Microbacterium sp. SORGH_AS_0888]MDQ1127906.1 GT2 family glycosyltransferase [Microbacterium sp. SORGH_AS_0888]